MPFPGPTTAFHNVQAERFAVFKVRPAGFDTLDFYVNFATGKDELPGNGTIANPYKTLPRALKYAATLARQEQAIFHLVGPDKHLIPLGYVWPAQLSPDQIDNDPAKAFGFVGVAPVVITADPTLERTVPGANIVSQTNDATSQLNTIVTNLVMVAGAHDGQWVLDAVGTLQRIRSNTITDLLLCGTGPLVAPLQIYTESATIASDTPGAFTACTVQLNGSTCPLIFQGVKVESTGLGGVELGPGSRAQFVASTLDNLSLGEDFFDTLTAPSALELKACHLSGTAFTWFSGHIVSSNSYWNTTSFSIGDAFTAGFLTECIFEKMPGPLFSAQAGGVATVDKLRATLCEVIDSDGDAFESIGGGLSLDHVKITGAGGAAVRLRENAAGSLGTVGGTGNARGVKVDTGSVAEVSATTNVAGTAGADVIVEGLPIPTWANFRAGTAPFALKAPGGSSVIQGTDSAESRHNVLTNTTTPQVLTADKGVLFVDTTAGVKVVNLDPIATKRGQAFGVSKLTADGNRVTINASAGETINGAASLNLTQAGEVVFFIAPDQGTDWRIVSSLASSSAIGGATDVQIFTATGAGVWTKPAGAKYVNVTLIGAGGGGGSGRVDNAGTLRGGGGGGGGGGITQEEFVAAALGATENLTVGAGGAGGAAVAATADGNPGVAGGNSIFGTTLALTAFGGALGNGGTGAAGGVAGAGGLGSRYGNATSGTGGQGGNGSNGAAAGANGATSTVPSGARGGAGGGGISAGDAAQIGGVGGAFTNTLAAAGGTAGGLSAPGGPGNSSATDRQGTGGGGGGSSVAASAGDGGAGGSFGGGGGGGGAAVNGTGDSGKGGDGANGIIIVVTYL